MSTDARPLAPARFTGRSTNPLRERAWDAWVRRVPDGLVRAVSLPVGRRAKTAELFVHESARMMTNAFAFTRGERVLGDYAEFGVFRGQTFVEAWDAARRFKRADVKLWAFDGFAGLPELDGPDQGGPFAAQQFDAPRAEFEATLRRHRVDRSRVEVVEGFFDASLAPERRAAIGLEQVAIAWVDCDLYTSTVPVLDYLTDRLADGAVLVFDDWFCFRARADKGEQLACAEWLERNPQIRLVPYQPFHWAGMSFVVQRSDRS